MLRFLNEALLRQASDNAFCTIGCATLERTADGGFEACLAAGGHPFPLLVRAGGRVEEVVVRGTMLGVESSPRLEPTRLPLGPGDTLVLYTDGVVDARADGGERFGEERLRAAVDAAAGGDAADVASAVDEAVGAFEPDVQRDDRAIVVLRVSD
jgi:serine phosphatase RsbU (regulator of sigma subunit)